MGIFDFLKSVADNTQPNNSHGAISYGKQKNDGSHDHRTNTGNDRTPSQKEGDQKRRKKD